MEPNKRNHFKPDMSISELDVMQGEEVLSRRSRFGKVFALGGNRFQAVTYTEPVHRFDEKQRAWVEIDNCFHQQEDGSLTAANERMTVSCGRAGDAPFITLTDAQGRHLSWGLEGALAVLPQGMDDDFLAQKRRTSHTSRSVREAREQIIRQTNGAVAYAEVFPGINLVCHMGRRFKDDLVFLNREAVRPVVFNLTPDAGCTLKEDSTGAVDMVDAEHQVVFHLPAPFLMDAKGDFGNVAVQFERDGEVLRMTCTPDADFMEKAVFPVILDPAVESAQQGSAIEDTYVTQGSGYNNSTATTLRVDGDQHVYIRVKTLPALGENHFITKAYLCVKPAASPSLLNPNMSNEPRLMLREVLGDWSESTITFANQPAYSSLYQDYYTMPKESYDWCRLDVTSLARKWYLGTNYGVVFTPCETAPVQARLHSSAGTYPPYFVVNYASLAGLEGYLSYDQQSAGRAGTGSVSLLNGNLVFAHTGTAMNGLRMPVSVTHYYNSCDANKNEFGMGWGWRTSLHQTLHKEYLSGNVYFVYTDGDGTEHYFEGSGSSYTDMSGLSLKLTVGSANITITDKGDNVMTFPLVSATPTTAAPVTAKVLISSLADAKGNTVTIAASGLLINAVTDGSGRVTRFAYSGGLCSCIYTPWQSASTGTRFTYSSGQLIGVTYEDGQSSHFTYASSGSFRLLLTATGPEGITASYTYANRGAVDGLPHTITRAAVTGGSLTGTDTTYEYGNHLTRVIDNLTGKALRYHFNDNGNEVSIDDELGYAAYTRYDQSGDNANAPINHATLRSRMQKAVHNLLQDSSFEENSSVWSFTGTGSFARDTTHYQWGMCALKLTTASAAAASYSQTVTLTPGKSYTLSGYALSTAPSACVQIGYTVGSNTTYLKSDPVPVGTANGLQRTAMSFTLPSNASASVTCSAVASGAAGSSWFDCLQLEEGLTCNHYNLLHNSDLSRTGSSDLPTGWAKSDTTTSWATWQPLSSCTVAPPACLTGNAVHLLGRYDRSTAFQQEIRHYGEAGDQFTAGGWCSCFAKEPNADLYVSCRMNVQFGSEVYKDGGWVIDYNSGGTINWNYEEGNWQFASGRIVAPSRYAKIRFVIEYNRQMNAADFTGFYLYPEQFGTEYVYDAKGNAKSAKALFGKAENAAYDGFNNMTSYTAPGKSVATSYNYGTTDAERKKHLLLNSISPMGTKTTNTYSSHGNPTSATVSDNTGSTAAFIKTATGYTASGNYAHTQTDARGKTVTTTTEENRGTVTSVQDSNAQTVNYTYDTLRRPVKVTTTTEGKEYKNEYTYDAAKGHLTQVKHNTSANAAEDVAYNFAYDALGRPTTVKVGTQTLSTNAYNATGTLASTTFGNGGKVVNEYDAWNRITGVKYDSDTAARYTYAYNANGQVAQVKDTTLNRVTETEYDLANRPCRKKTHDGTAHVYTGELSYDPVTGNLSKYAERTGAGYAAYETTFGYDEENRPTALTYGGYGKTTSSFDKLGRVTTRSLMVGSGGVQNTTYTYVVGGHGTNSTTGLVQTITQFGTTLTYAYDNVGNITSVSDGTKTVSYTYDKLGQLTRANDPYDTTAGSAGTTWAYAYDQGGNILSKTAYAYTTGTVGTVVKTDSYTYGDSNWKDKLTAYNGTTIAYDAIGNPTSDGTWTYTWEKGRQLKQMVKSSETATFTYNADGLRVKKVCTTTGTTNYTLHGKNLVHLSNNGNDLHFFYDAQNRPAVVVFNGVAYGYVHNLQGDIVAIVNSAGTKVVEYAYDAWGKPLSKSGSMAGTLGTLNPFRYHGYVYDEETGLIYLRSRYYSAQRNRFLNSDSYFVEKNLYSYCKNCPTTQTDPDGEASYTYLGDGADDPVNSLMADDMALGGGGTWGALMRTLQSAAEGLNMAMGQRNAFHAENHHLYSNKNKTYSPQYREVMNRYDFSMNDPDNIVSLEGHSGRHTNVYHEFMLLTLHVIDDISNGDKTLFKEGLNIMREYIVEHPGLPYAR